MTATPLHLLAPWLAERLGESLEDMAPVGGGCIHRAWCLQLAGGRRLFAKTNQGPAAAMFDAEAAGLRALARWASPPLQVPEPLAVGSAGPLAVLVLPWLELQAGRADRTHDWHQLGRGLAELHRRSCGGEPCFGFGADNFIGSAPQTNTWHQDWARFFADCRLAPQLRRASAAGRCLRGAERLLAELPAWLAKHHCEPVLVHGDLWSGNAALLAPGAGGALFDPATHWADREVDLAMARLFGGFPPAFFRGYAESWPLPDGAEQRVPLYNLYHLLNHANLFGGGYWDQAQASIDALLAAGPVW